MTEFPMLNRFSLLAVLCSLSVLSIAQSGYQIKVHVDNYDHDTLYLGFYYGDKQYLKDTAILAKGKFVFDGEKPLDPGMYLILLQPDNSFVQLNINRGKQQMDIKFDAKDPVNSFSIKGDKDNQAFYEYIRYLNNQRPEADALRKQLENPELSAEEKSKLEEKLIAINEKVKAFQEKMVTDYKGTLTAALISSFQEMTIPQFEGEERDVQVRKYRYFMDHYFDGIDFSDERMIRTSFFFTKVNDYVQKHTVQIPDSLIRAVDHVLGLCKNNEEAFKFFLVHFVNVYAKSNIIGMDAVYVHIVDEYYAKGAAPWVDEEQLNKMVKNAESLRPILIGEIAPNIKMEKRDGTKSPFMTSIPSSPYCSSGLRIAAIVRSPCPKLSSSTTSSRTRVSRSLQFVPKSPTKCLTVGKWSMKREWISGSMWLTRIYCPNSAPFMISSRPPRSLSWTRRRKSFSNVLRQNNWTV